MCMPCPCHDIVMGVWFHRYAFGRAGSRWASARVYYDRKVLPGRLVGLQTRLGSMLGASRLLLWQLAHAQAPQQQVL